MDFHEYHIFDRISIFIKGNCAGDAFEILNFREALSDFGTINGEAALDDGMGQEVDGIHGPGGPVGGNAV